MRTNFGPGPQGLDIKPLLDETGLAKHHHYLGGEFYIDPASLQRPDGGDPFLVLADGRTVRQVRADHAAELLLPEVPNGDSKFRLATDEEVATYLADEKRKTDDYRAAAVARINREADELRAEKLAELDRMQELEAAKVQVGRR